MKIKIIKFFLIFFFIFFIDKLVFCSNSYAESVKDATSSASPIKDPETSTIYKDEGSSAIKNFSSWNDVEQYYKNLGYTIGNYLETKLYNTLDKAWWLYLKKNNKDYYALINDTGGGTYAIMPNTWAAIPSSLEGRRSIPSYVS